MSVSDPQKLVPPPQEEAPVAPDARLVSALPPEELTGIKLKPLPKTAAGLPALGSVLSYTNREMGFLKGLQLLTVVNQHGGFDCPSCAWPDPAGERSVAEFCENGARAVADEATEKRVTPDFFAQHSVAELLAWQDHALNAQGRLTQPMVLRPGSTHYTPISWEDAFSLVAGELKGLASPDEAVFYTSGRTSNEAAFLYQLFVRQYGTNNLPDCSNMCHESSGVALTETIGIGKGTVTLEDFSYADAIFVIGQNPGTNHPRMLSALEEAADNGAEIVSINPLPEVGLSRFKNPQRFMNPLRAAGTLLGKGSALGTLHLPVRIGGDIALLKGIMKTLLEAEAAHPGEVLDGRFIEDETEGFEAFKEALELSPWDTIVEESGLTQEEIYAAAEVVVRNERIIFCWAMGLTQHKHAVATIQEVVNLALLRGNIGVRGAGLCPVRGHSNVQGDRTMGITERPSEGFLETLAKHFSFNPPRKPGLNTVEAIEAMAKGRAKVFFALGGNFLSATPDTEYTAEALRNCRLTVQVSTKLNRSHLVCGRSALILPTLGRTERDVQATGEQFVSVENSMGVVHASAGRQAPASEGLLSEVAIVTRLAEATLARRSSLDWSAFRNNYERIRTAISKTIPGFEDFNSRVRHPDGFYLPNGPRERTFTTPSGKAQFTVHELPRLQLESGHYLMMTIRSHDQFNTTIYGLDDRYRGVHNERRVVYLNPEDMEAAGIRTGDVLDLTSHFEGETRLARHFVAVAYAIPRRCAATYFPETNVLVPLRSYADKSFTPTSKSIVITLSWSDEARGGVL